MLQVLGRVRVGSAEVARVQAAAHVRADGQVVDVRVGAREEGAEGGFAGAGGAWGGGRGEGC